MTTNYQRARAEMSQGDEEKGSRSLPLPRREFIIVDTPAFSRNTAREQRLHEANGRSNGRSVGALSEYFPPALGVIVFANPPLVPVT